MTDQTGSWLAQENMSIEIAHHKGETIQWFPHEQHVFAEVYLELNQLRLVFHSLVDVQYVPCDCILVPADQLLAQRSCTRDIMGQKVVRPLQLLLARPRAWSGRRQAEEWA